MSTTGYGEITPLPFDSIGQAIAILLIGIGYTLFGALLARLIAELDNRYF
jgi:hypothetical protein